MRLLSSIAAFLLLAPSAFAAVGDWPEQFVQMGVVAFVTESWPIKPTETSDIAGLYENDLEGSTEWYDSSGLWGLSCTETSTPNGACGPMEGGGCPIAGVRTASMPGKTLATAVQANCASEFSTITTGTVVVDLLLKIASSSGSAASAAFRMITSPSTGAYPSLKVDPDGAAGGLGVLAACSTVDSTTVVGISTGTYKIRMVYDIATDVNTAKIDLASGTWGAGAVGTSACDGAGIAQVLDGVQYRGGVTFDSLIDNVGICTSVPTSPGRCGIF